MRFFEINQIRYAIDRRKRRRHVHFALLHWTQFDQFVTNLFLGPKCPFMCSIKLLQLKGGSKNGTAEHEDNRASKMFSRDCQLMGLTWLLARNKTAYIPTVSAVLRAIMYSSHPPHESKCSPDQENMPLAVDSLQFEKTQSSSSSPSRPQNVPAVLVPFLPLISLFSLLV